MRNVGCEVSPADVDLITYWTTGGSGESWPADWTTAHGTFSGIAESLGHEIGLVAIDTISPGASAIYTYTYTPPNPTHYSGTPVPYSYLYGGQLYLDVCFLSYIDDGHNLTGDPTYGLTINPSPVTDPAQWCLDNNNMATINTNDLFVSGPIPPPPHVLTIGNVSNVRAVSLQMINQFTLTPSQGASTLSNYSYYKMYLGDLYDIWQGAGGFGTYISRNASEKSITFDGTRTMQLDSIHIDSGSRYYVEVAGFLKKGVDFSQMQAERLCFRQLDDATGKALAYFNYNVISPANSPSGVLAVTEISQGPPSDGNGGTGNCEYAEMIVANSGNDYSPFVDVSGWIIDDNADNFDTAGCLATGVTKGHYRLPYNSIWKSVPVGSRIVIYNGDNNCYNLPDTFYIDTVNAVFWIPVNSIAGTGSSSVLERFTAAENTGNNICSDTGTTVYVPASDWENTIALAEEDAFQVRCPGCTTAYPVAPPFYHGLGYAPDYSQCFVSIPPGIGNIGGPVEINPNANQKYVFTGSTAADLGDPTQWTAYNANAAGSPPPTLGNVNSTFYQNVITHSLGLPACFYGHNNQDGNGARKSGAPITPVTQDINNGPQKISVYPNPASMKVYFTFPSSGQVTIKLMDVTGRLMDEQVVNNTDATSFNVVSYTPGIYMYQVITNGITQTGKIIIGK